MLKCTKMFKLYKMHTLPLSEFRAQISAMVDLVEQGETVLILRHGKPVAELRPAQMASKSGDRRPSWKQAFEPVVLPTGKSFSQAVLAEREQYHGGV